MEELTKAEERIMQVLWKLERAFVKDIIDALDDEPKPPYNTISSIVRLLEKKGYVSYRAYGKTYEYFPAISKEDYAKTSFSKLFAGYSIIHQKACCLLWLNKKNLAKRI